jgi:hypothetical protein
MALVFVWGVLNATGGERIQFPTQKTTLLPQTQNKLAKDKLSALERAPSANPYDVIVSPNALNSSVPRRDHKDEKRLEKARMEKENWMILDQGELQEQEDEESVFGLRDYSLEEEKSAADLWFGPKEEADSKGSTRARGPNSISRNPSQGRLPSNPGQSQVVRRFDHNAIQRPATQVGDHTSKELNTRIMAGESTVQPSKDFFGTGPSIRPFDDRNRNGSDFGLRSLESSPTRSSLGRGLGLRELNPAALPRRIEPSASQSKSALGLSPGSRYQGPSSVNLAPPSSPAAPTQPRNEMAPTATRDLFAPPPLPGSFGNR